MQRVDLDVPVLRGFAAQRKTHGVRGRTAMLYANPLIFGFIRMWMAVMDQGPLEIMPFEDPASAIAWLTEMPDA